jgi:hypothetical protein
MPWGLLLSRARGVRTTGVPKSYLTGNVPRPYPARVTDTARSSYFYGFFYYGFPLAGRDWRRTRE